MFQKQIKRLMLRFMPSRMLVNFKKIHYIRALRSATEGREPDLRIAHQFTRAGDVVVDLGANFGIYTASLAHRVGSMGKVISVEPIPEMFEILSSNVQKLNLTNVTLKNLAVSSHTGLVRMEIPEYESGGENYYEAKIVPHLSLHTGEEKQAPKRFLEIPATTLDQILQDQARVDFIKCDVEGHEFACLEGAQAILKRFLPAWLIEVSGNPDTPASNAAQLFDLLTQNGYRAYRYDGKVLHPRRAFDRSINYFFFRPEHCERLSPEYFATESGDRSQAA